MIGLLNPPLLGVARYCRNLLCDPQFRQNVILQSRLKKIPRFTEFEAQVEGWNLRAPDAASFLSSFYEIFTERIYAFEFPGGAPRILDLGANIGLSALFFKKIFPAAKITAVEADPRIFAYLQHNVHGNGYADVRLVNKAAWHEETVLEFNSEGADGGRLVTEEDGNIIQVEAFDVRKLLVEEPFDFLKMDIEGAEGVVLPACGEALAGVKFVFVEYHSRVGEMQHLDAIVEVLAKNGFRLHVHSLQKSPSPFVDLRVSTGFDLQLNIFAWRQ